MADRENWVTLYEMLQVVALNHKEGFRGSSFKSTLFRPKKVEEEDGPPAPLDYNSLGDVLDDGWEPLSPWEPKALDGIQQFTFWFKRKRQFFDPPGE